MAEQLPVKTERQFADINKGTSNAGITFQSDKVSTIVQGRGFRAEFDNVQGTISRLTYGNKTFINSAEEGRNSTRSVLRPTTTTGAGNNGIRTDLTISDTRSSATLS